MLSIIYDQSTDTIIIGCQSSMSFKSKTYPITHEIWYDHGMKSTNRIKCLSCGWRGEAQDLEHLTIKLQASPMDLGKKACPLCKSIAVEKIRHNYTLLRWKQRPYACWKHPTLRQCYVKNHAWRCDDQLFRSVRRSFFRPPYLYHGVGRGGPIPGGYLHGCNQWSKSTSITSA